MWIFDAHLDLSLNALDYNRDLRLPLDALRQSEQELKDYRFRGHATTCFPELRSGQFGMVVATLLAPCLRPENPVPGWRSPEQSWAHVQGQWAWYQEMIDQGFFTSIHDLNSLNHWQDHWENAPESDRRIGMVLSLEGADPIIRLPHLERLTEQGLRALGPAHYGKGRYANGTGTTEGFDDLGRDLLRVMDQCRLILDVTHLSDACFWEALDQFQGPIWASHNNCRALVDHGRQFTDDQIKALIDRGSVIGCALDAWMLIPEWQRGVSTPQGTGVSLSHFIDHMDHVCQIAGNAKHVGIGSDLDGGFGAEQTAREVDSIADLQKIEPLLIERGYNAGEVEGIMHGNFLGFLKKAWDK